MRKRVLYLLWPDNNVMNMKWLPFFKMLGERHKLNNSLGYAGREESAFLLVSFRDIIYNIIKIINWGQRTS
jgi:hypothetical protein